MSQAPDTAVVLAGGLANFHGFALAPYPRFSPLANRPLLYYQAGFWPRPGSSGWYLPESRHGAAVAEHLDSLPNSLNTWSRKLVMAPEAR